MAKIVLVCLRQPDSTRSAVLREALEGFLESLRPDNLPSAPVEARDDGRGLFLGVFNPGEPAAVKDQSAYAGWLAQESPDWWRTGTPAPEGTYALFRSDADMIELIADAAGSRTIWMAQTNDLFVASTSQRAIPWFLGSFAPNAQAVLWMLSAGSLGAEPWDKRARPLRPAGIARLDRKPWQLQVHEPSVAFKPDPADYQTHKARLRETLQQTFAQIRFDPTKWVLPLSGGNDSRAILLALKNREGLRCITWGLRSALHVPDSDAVVAAKVARHLHEPHEYFATDLSDEPVELLLNRFLIAGEGRVDHISGYMDGFHIWRTLAERNVKGIVRGDHAFGYHEIREDKEARLINGLTLWSDFSKLPSLATLDLDHLGEQRIDPEFERKPTEDAREWRDRLYQTVRVATTLAALNDLKAAYVEIANPLLLSPLIALARTHPAELRTRKKLFRDVVEELDIPVPHAQSIAIASPDDVLRSTRMRSLLLDELSSRSLRQIFSPTFAEYITGNLGTDRTGVQPQLTTRLKGGIKRLLPPRMRAQLRRPKAPELPLRRIALRAYIVSRMFDRLRRDAQALG